MLTQYSDLGNSRLETSLDQDAFPATASQRDDAPYKLDRPLRHPDSLRRLSIEARDMDTHALANSRHSAAMDGAVPTVSVTRSIGLGSPNRSCATDSSPNALDRQYMGALSISYEAGMYGFKGFLSDSLADAVTYAYFRRHLELTGTSW